MSFAQLSPHNVLSDNRGSKAWDRPRARGNATAYRDAAYRDRCWRGRLKRVALAAGVEKREGRAGEKLRGRGAAGG